MAVKRFCDFCGDHIPAFVDFGTITTKDIRGDEQVHDTCSKCGKSFEEWKRLMALKEVKG